MDFTLTRDQKEVLDRTEEACCILRKKEEQSWHAGEINAELERVLKRARLMNFPLSAKYGGEGGDFVIYGLVLERIAQEGLSPHAFLLSHDSSALAIQEHATDEQSASILKNILASPFKGHSIGYEKQPGGYVLNGEKPFVVNSLSSGIVTVFADGQQGRTAFAVRKNNDIHVERLKRHGLRSADLGKIKFTDFFVRKENVIGTEGFGWKVEDTHSNLTKLISAAGYVGAAKDCLYEIERSIDAQSASFTVNSKMKARVRAASLLARHAMWLSAKAKENKQLRKEAEEQVKLAHAFAYDTAMQAAKYGVMKLGAQTDDRTSRQMRHFIDLAVANYWSGNDI